MKIRTFEPEKDFAGLKGWAADERTHYLWCAGRFAYPLEMENFMSVLDEYKEKYGDAAYTVTEDEGSPVGFFVGNHNPEDNSIFLKFVILDSRLHHQGNGLRMMQCISDYFYFAYRAAVLKLVVFDVNRAAVSCYEKAGFVAKRVDRESFCFQDEEWRRYGMEKDL